MMAIKYFDNNLNLGKDLEIDIWREGNLVEVYGTSRYGLAYSAAIRGLNARVTSNTDEIDFVDRFIPPLKDLNMQVLKLHFNERRHRCRKLGVNDRQLAITENIIYDALLSGHIPLVVTNALFCEKENLPHWVVITGIDNRFVYINNPLDTNSRKRKLALSALQKVIGYVGEQSMVEVWKQNGVIESR